MTGTPRSRSRSPRRHAASGAARAYADLAYLDFLQPEIERLEELRLVALEERLDALLELGRHADALAEILRLAWENPLRERLQRQAMLTLYRSGRQSEALEHFAALRRRLDEELGLAPRPTCGSCSAGSSSRTLPSRPDPAQTHGGRFPPPNPLIGREQELERLWPLCSIAGTHA